MNKTSLWMAAAMLSAGTLGGPPPLQAEEQIVIYEDPGKLDLPPSFKDFIRKNRPIRIFSAEGETLIEGPLRYVDELIMQPGSSLVFKDRDQPFFGIVARRIRFVDVTSGSAFARSDEWSLPPADKGSAGTAGERGTRSGRDGG